MSNLLNPSTFYWIKAEDRTVYELDYVVTMFEDEGPEYVRMRKVAKLGDFKVGLRIKPFEPEECEWVKLSEEEYLKLPDDVIAAADEHWHGPVSR